MSSSTISHGYGFRRNGRRRSVRGEQTESAYVEVPVHERREVVRIVDTRGFIGRLLGLPLRLVEDVVEEDVQVGTRLVPRHEA